MRIAHLYDYLFSLASPNYFALCHIGHAAAALSGQPPHERVCEEMCDMNFPSLRCSLDFPPRSWPLRAAALPAISRAQNLPVRIRDTLPGQGRFIVRR